MSIVKMKKKLKEDDDYVQGEIDFGLPDESDEVNDKNSDKDNWGDDSDHFKLLRNSRK